ncbi:BTAD domain-containing putative transcriptional regulator [Actinomycetospora lutea]|uniref:ATP-binding protein n=1 Tax=Actinomycetospora lutea TaxID=663604 RepID=UPI002365D358|nr:BTAD domain-containing putative transcriptional regulator [Actinomycetospora lutea]MDD7938989.1 BTAD domain-containing putative transcriptional regulator [Actinomycetospora lutea]
MIPPDDVDSARFERLAVAARDAAGDGDPAETWRRCDEALDLWRGPPYEVVAHATATAAVVARLAELRGQVAERRLDALLALGHPDRVLLDLEPLQRDHPFREPLWARRMAALDALGRTEEALATFHRARTLLCDELGLEPGRELQEQQRAVMTRDPAPAVPIAPSAPVHLPARPGPLVGRERELGEIADVLATSPLTTITGPGGCGKTRLAIQSARDGVSRFPDGIWFVDLTEVLAGGAVADMVVTRLGLLPGGSGPTAALRAFVRDRRALVVLDNCEHVIDEVAALVEELLTEEPRTTLLATSREPLDVEGEVVRLLGPLALTPGPAGPSPAAELFLARARGRVDDLPLIERICAGVDGLPLAVELAAARTRSFTPAEIAEQVASDPGGLGRVGRGPADHRRTVREAIEWSHRLLDTDERTVHRALSVLPGPFTLPAAAAVVGPALDVADVPTLLARLAHRSLLSATPPDRPGRPTVFRQLDTVRAHGRHHLAASGEEARTLARRDAWVRGVLAARPRLGRAEEADWYDLLEENWPVVRATLDDLLVDDPDPGSLRLGAELLWFGYYRTRVHEVSRWLERAVRSAGTDADGLTVRLVRAGARILLGDLEGGGPLLRDVLPLLDTLDLAVEGREGLRALVEVGVGAVGSAWTHNAYDLVARGCVSLSRVAAALGEPDLDLVLDAMACAEGLGSTDHRELADLAERATAIHDRAVGRDHICATWVVSAVNNIVAQLLEDPEAGIPWTERLIVSQSRLGTGGTGVYVEAMANLLVMRGELAEAVTWFSCAYAQTRRAGMVWPARPHTQALIDRASAGLTPDAHRTAWQEGAPLSTTEIMARRTRSLVC